jgi:tRNA pseudouridine38-40 synthase
MKRFKITLGYDGTNYFGWQVQPNAVTVQGEIEAVLLRLSGETVKVHGSGRTDRGVHAKGQAAHFDLEKPFEAKALGRALNALLPADIRVMRIANVKSDFHARKHAVSKIYCYFIWNDSVLPPLERFTHLQVRHPLDVEAMREAAAMLIGRHDFAAFTANPKDFVESTVRTLISLDIRARGKEIAIVARGEGFLYKMVRSLAGWLIRVGKGEVKPEDTKEILESKLRTSEVPTARPHGLILWSVKY